MTVFLMVLAPKHIEKMLRKESYSDWLKTEKEPKALIINVWHIVGFRPYIGSIGSWLNEQANRYKKSLIGIHFNVTSMTKEEAAAQMMRGSEPDIISFMAGEYPCDELYCINDLISGTDGINTEGGAKDGRLYALPYCASGTVLIYDPYSVEGLDTEQIASSAGTAESFKRSKAPACICDLRAAGDIYRAALTGNGPYFEAEPYGEDPVGGLVQYVGINRRIDEVKLKYALGFLSFITEAETQSSLCGLGLLPVNSNAETEYEQKWIGELFRRFDQGALPRCFN